MCIWGFPGGTSGKEPTCQCRRHERYMFYPWVRKIPWRRAWQPTLVFLPGESHGQRSLAGYSPWGRKESDTTERLITGLWAGVEKDNRALAFSVPLSVKVNLPGCRGHL